MRLPRQYDEARATCLKSPDRDYMKCAEGSCKSGVEARRLAPVGRGLSRRGQNKDTGIATTTY